MQTLDFSRIHKFEFDDLKILLDINSGSVHIIDEIAWDFLNILEDNPWEDTMYILAEKHAPAYIKETAEQLQSLISQNLLFSDDSEIKNYTPHTEPLVKALCLHMAHDCNLRCGYCFADTGAYGGTRGLMSVEVGKKALDFLIASSKHRRHIEVDFFGGEPLLNFDVCKELVAYGKEQGAIHDKIFKFTLTTNGVLLSDEVQDFLNQEGIDAVLSLDGRKETNDRMRKFPQGSGSYDYIVSKFQQLVKKRNQQNYYLRGTYTHWNLDFAADVAHMSDELGFRELSMEPVVAPQSCDYALKPEDLDKLKEQYDILTRHYLSKLRQGEGYNFFHFNIDPLHGPCLPKRLSGCGSGHDYLAVSPEGDLYPCHQFVGEESYKIGTVYEGITNPAICKTFQQAHVLTKPTCMQCWARFYCSGGCHANNIRYGGDIHTPYAFGCELQKKRLECAIYIQIKKLTWQQMSLL